MSNYKTPAHVRPGTHRALAVKAMIDGNAAGSSYEEIVKAIFTAVSTAGGSITEGSAHAWYRNLHEMIKNPDGSDICAAPPATRPRVRKDKPEQESAEAGDLQPVTAETIAADSEAAEPSLEELEALTAPVEGTPGVERAMA